MLPCDVGDAARDGDLDPIRAFLDLLANDVCEAVGAIRLQRTVAAGGHDHLAGGLDARPDHLAAVDRAAQREIGAVILADQAQRRDPREQRQARVAGHPQHLLRIGFGRQRIAGRTRQFEAQMHVHVHEPWNEPLAVHGDDLGARRNGRRVGGTDSRNALAGNH